MHHLAPAEADLALGRVHVHVHLLGRHGEQQRPGRLIALHEKALHALGHRVAEHPVLHRPAVDQQAQPSAGRGRTLRQQQKTGHNHALAVRAAGAGQRQQRSPGAKHLADPAFQIPAGRPGKGLAAVHGQAEPGGRVGQGQVFHHLLDVGQFGAHRLEELAPGRHVAEQVAHLHDRTVSAAVLVHRLQAAVADVRAGAEFLAARPGEDAQPRHRGDTGDGLAAEPEGADGGQLALVAELGGGVAFETEQHVVAVHARAVVGHAQQPAAAALHLDIDAGGAGVQAVFDQFLDHRGGTLHHLAGGDLVGELFGEQAYSGQEFGMVDVFVWGCRNRETMVAWPGRLPGRPQPVGAGLARAARIPSPTLLFPPALVHPALGKSGHSRRDGTHPHTPPGARPAAADQPVAHRRRCGHGVHRHGARLVPRPARHPHRGRLPAAGGHPGARPPRSAHRRHRPPVPNRHPLRGDAPAPAPGLCRRRGQPFLGAHRPGRLVHRPGRSQQPARRPPQPGRLDHHPADHPRPAAHPGEELPAQAGRGDSRPPHRAHAVQGGDPLPLPE